MMILTKKDCCYIIEMLESNLINYRYTQPWADNLIISINNPPSWLCDVSINKYQGKVLKAFREFAYSEPFEKAPADLEKFHVACLWLRHERGEISWATFL